MGNPDHGTTYMRVRGDDGELRPWHFIYVYSIENRLMLHACLEADDECLEGGKGARSPFVHRPNCSGVGVCPGRGGVSLLSGKHIAS